MTMIVIFIITLYVLILSVLCEMYHVGISREDELKILQHKYENNMIKLVHNLKEDKAKRLSKEPKTK